MSYQQDPNNDSENKDQKDQNESQDSNENRPQGENGQGGPGGPKPPTVFSRSSLAWIVLAGLVVALLITLSSGSGNGMPIAWNEFQNYAKQGAFEPGSITVDDSNISAKFKPGATGLPQGLTPNSRVTVKSVSTFQLTSYTEKLDDLGIVYKNEPSNHLLTSLLISWGPLILIAFLIYFFIFRSIRAAGGGPGGMLGQFGRSKAKMLNKEHSKIRLTDVAGIDEAKDEVSEIVEFLKNPKKFQRLGGRVPRGVLLMGNPGCGKTLLAKAVAGEADVPFFSISGSDFVEMFVGVGASRVRDLFKQAKENSPCIIFLDEIDAVGRRRGTGFNSGGHDEREQTLNAILVEMDGFESNDQVIVMAATNRSDVLDPALTRPGRFDRQIVVPMPDLPGRFEILKVHAKKIKMGPNVDLEKLARGTPMFSGADLEAIINEAAISATLLNKDFVEQDDLEEARDKVKWGRARKSAKIEEDERRVVAYHEAGHAVITHFDPDADPVHKVTIIPRGQSLGTTHMLPEKDKHLYSRKQLLAMMRVSYGGRIGELKYTGDMYNGTAGDIRQASNIARSMVTEFGMSEKAGFFLYAPTENDNPWEHGDSFSNETNKLVDDEIRDLINTTYKQAEQIIEDHAQQVEDLAQALLKYETLNSEEVQLLMDGKKLEKATVADILAAEAKNKKAEEEKEKQDAAETQSDTDPDTPSTGEPATA
ncbi:ATP-dependent zinc metalloprotease FtsH [Poriferisphaera corsica]|uniref:ATP-dependent zinc metalloprotease FtsH n=1 Tax=Poriferisphaera corsica TaxID=2528020 RepID=A0A517YRL8_9BACT|nr:ATP-dependent zinc metalloprotease FtsH [Poriferisphaera corsica]QDU32854.1 ATP-dependent zinc metalloprotease FtsH [Poriferisphaera corsica]